MIKISFKDFIDESRIMLVAEYKTAPIKHMVLDAKQNDRLFNMTHGKAINSVIITQEKFIFLSPLRVETVAKRINERSQIKDEMND